ncbi:hypothetical protein NNX28_14260 [Arthrobacter sp. zg-Y859]|uniref:Uncharacterized protein n=1 Tax=Arthrobacter jinronghuae TaxID=2964609 RepID=A0ABT1NTM9_9MICC|nr:hypothetical protein [Arthrobacter jinronghuae]MCQ1951083.1 hypothetical protein [Arthrobacter jinronghuae]UWX79534.1 hypothetical protein N2K98_04860 [Arthrobacter jinronghuae]
MSVAMLTVILAVMIVRAPALPLLLVGAVVAILVFGGRPRLSLVIWMVAVAFIPHWVGINLIGYIPIVSVISAAILAANLFNGQWKSGKGDLPILLLIVIGLIAVAIGNSSQGVWFSMISQWLLAYLVGKAIVSAAGIGFSVKTVAAVFGLVGVLSVVEFAFSWHPFVELVTPIPSYETWAPIQVRGGLDRSEWSMGHSIALGGVLSAAVPFALRSSLGKLSKPLLLIAIFAGIACTFSRAAIISAVLTLALSLLFMRGVKPALRFMLLIVIGAAGFVGLMILVPIFELASLETAGSSSYRLRMFVELIPELSALGRSDVASVGADGTVYYGTFQSIDSAFLAVALGFGWIAALVMLVPFVIMSIRTVRRTATTGEIALVGQLPMLFTVALITQYQLVLWFFVGIAVAEFRVRAKAVDGASKDSSGYRARLGVTYASPVRARAITR